MIQVIGLMIAAYILTRCVEVGKHPSAAVRVHAALTYLWTLLCIVLLWIIPLPK